MGIRWNGDNGSIEPIIKLSSGDMVSPWMSERSSSKSKEMSRSSGESGRFLYFCRVYL